KRHLFTYAREHERYAPGRDRLVVELKGWRIHPLVCYDLRFPVFARNTLDPATGRPDFDLQLYVANWPAARAYAWKTLLRARAIENACYVAGLNRVGRDGNGLAYSGDSAEIDFLGAPLSQSAAARTPRRRAAGARATARASTGPAAAGLATRRLAAGPGAARRARTVVARAGIGVVGREHRGIARMAVGMRRARARLAARAGARLGAARLARAAGAGIAMSRGAGVDAVGHVPAAERRRVALGQRALVLARLQRLVRLPRRGLAGHRQAAGGLALAATAAILAHVVEAAQFAALVGGVVAAHVALAAVLPAH